MPPTVISDTIALQAAADPAPLEIVLTEQLDCVPSVNSIKGMQETWLFCLFYFILAMLSMNKSICC